MSERQRQTVRQTDIKRVCVCACVHVCMCAAGPSFFSICRLSLMQGSRSARGRHRRPCTREAEPPPAIGHGNFADAPRRLPRGPWFPCQSGSRTPPARRWGRLRAILFILGLVDQHLIAPTPWKIRERHPRLYRGGGGGNFLVHPVAPYKFSTGTIARVGRSLDTGARAAWRSPHAGARATHE